MSDEPEWLKSGNEGELRAAIKFTGVLGEVCEPCSSGVPANFKYGKTIYHPHGRNEHGQDNSSQTDEGTYRHITIAQPDVGQVDGCDAGGEA